MANGRIAGVLIVSLLFGCAGPGAKLFPVAPLRETTESNGHIRRFYDCDDDGRPDCGELLGDDGRVTALLVGGDAGEAVPFDPHQAKRELLIILDSVPFELVRDAWTAGR